MVGLVASSNVKEAQIKAVVIRSNGTLENLGTVAYYHRNPFRRWLWRLKEMLHG